MALTEAQIVIGFFRIDIESFIMGMEGNSNTIWRELRAQFPIELEEQSNETFR